MSSLVQRFLSWWRREPVSAVAQLQALHQELKGKLQALDTAILEQAKIVHTALDQAALKPELQILADQAQAHYNALVQAKQTTLRHTAQQVRQLQSDLQQAQQRELQAQILESLQDFQSLGAVQLSQLEMEIRHVQAQAQGRLRASQSAC